MTASSAGDGDRTDRRAAQPAGADAPVLRDAIADSPAPRRRGDPVDPRSRAETHTRIVNTAKVALPVAAAAILAAIAVWPLFTGEGEVGRAGPEVGSLEMVDARFVGTDRKSRPFEVRAARVAQGGGGSAVDLVGPQAEITLPGGDWITVSAAQGRYDQDSGRLTLAGQVTLYHDGGYEFVTDAAELDTRTGEAWGAAAVRGQGPIGTIEAGGFRIVDDGDTILFTGRSRLRLEDGVEQGPG
ncbi:MAG: hypothetical protein RLY86_3026 [Pseudomonadota bacterium]|jgi:lipopolysaccharide export system protein LptC